MQSAKQQMIFLNAAGDNFGHSAQQGAEMGKHLISCGFVETFRKMWRRHFSDSLFDAEETDRIVLYNLLVSLQVAQWTCY